MKSTLLLSSLVFSLNACTQTTTPGQADDAASAVEEVDLQLPSRGQMPQTVADQLTAYRFSVMATNPGPTCDQTAADAVNQNGDYDEHITLSAKLKRGCVYNVALDIGYLEASDSDLGSDLDVVYTGVQSVDTAAQTGDRIALVLSLHLNPELAGKLPDSAPVVATVVPAADVDLQVAVKFPDAATDAGYPSTLQPYMAGGSGVTAASAAAVSAGQTPASQPAG
jgi:hypothetical protein